MERRSLGATVGHLWFDEAELRIWNRTLEVTASRDTTEVILVRRFAWSARVRVVYRSGFEPRTYFAASNPKAVLRELRARQWPVAEGRRPARRP
jgi:hypothetical protein